MRRPTPSAVSAIPWRIPSGALRPRARGLVVAVLLVTTAVACRSAGSPETTPPPEAVTTSAAPVTTGPVTTSPVSTSPVSTSPVTTSPVTSGPISPGNLDWVPDHYRFGGDGLYIIRSGTATMILPDRVDIAASDWFGGVVIQSGAYGENWDPHRLPAGATEPQLVAGAGRPLASLVGVVAGRPSVVGIDTEPYVDEGGTVAGLFVFDLETGELHRLGGEFGTFGDAGGLLPNTVGGDLVGGVQFATVGSLATSQSIHFWRLPDGREVDIVGNPFPEPCAPCELDIRLAPDGASFAYLYRPDAKWPAVWSDAGEIDLLSWEEWWDSSKSIPAQLVVVDVAKGTESFRLEVDAGPRLAEFDGRYAVLNGLSFEDTIPSMIIDTSRSGRVAAVPGRVALISTLAVLDGKEM